MSGTHCRIAGHGYEVFTVQITFFMLSILTVSLRIYVRASLVKSFGLDDWCVILSCIFFAVYSGLTVVGVCNGYGQHIYTPGVMLKLVPIVKYTFLSGFFCILSGMCVKLSIAMQLLRFTAISRRMKWAVYTTITIFELSSMVAFLVLTFTCIPLSLVWTRLEGSPNGRCLSMEASIIPHYVVAGTFCLTDIAFVILPIILIRKMLFVNFRTKMMVVVLLSIGSIASVATIVRLFYLHEAFFPTDPTWSSTGSIVWATCELGLAIIASSAATLKPLVLKVASRLSFRSQGSTRASEEDVLYIEQK